MFRVRMHLQPIILSDMARGDAIFAFQVVGVLFFILFTVAITARFAR